MKQHPIIGKPIPVDTDALLVLADDAEQAGTPVTIEGFPVELRSMSIEATGPHYLMPIELDVDASGGGGVVRCVTGVTVQGSDHPDVLRVDVDALLYEALLVKYMRLCADDPRPPTPSLN